MYERERGWISIKRLCMVPTESHAKVVPSCASVLGAGRNCFAPQTDPHLIDDFSMRGFGFLETHVLCTGKQIDMIREWEEFTDRSNMI